MLIPQAIVQQGSAAAVDPVQAVLGTPTNSYDAAGILGLTQMGSSPTAENANSTIPSNYYLNVAANASINWKGRYTAYATPFTAVAKFTAFAGYGAFNAGGLFVGASTPGAFSMFGSRTTSTAVVAVQATGWTGPTGTGSDLGAFYGNFGGNVPGWYAVRATDSDDVDFFVSYNGYLWSSILPNHNPSFTVGAVGVAANAESASNSVAMGVEYLRIWNSALTLPGSG